MSDNIEFRTGTVGFDDDWDMTVEIPYAGTTPGKFVVTPKTGHVAISYVDEHNQVRFWDGSAFVIGPQIALMTTIVGKRSYLPFTPPAEVRGRTVHFEGWINGYPTPSKHVYVLYSDIEPEIVFAGS